MKSEIVGRTMTEFTRLRPKTYFYLIDDGNSDTMYKKRILQLNDYENWLLNNEII